MGQRVGPLGFRDIPQLIELDDDNDILVTLDANIRTTESVDYFCMFVFYLG